MNIDIVFISYNRCSEVQWNLSKMSLYKGLNKIIWVDNGSKDEVEKIKYNPDRVKFIALKDNVGIEAYNIGVRSSEADILIILDDDSHVEEAALDAIKERFAEDGELGALALKIVLPATGQDVTVDWKEGPVTYFWGCGAAVRKSLWNKLGGYREELFLYGNEYDLCIRIWNLGFKVLYSPTIIAYHRVSNMNRTSGRLISYSLRNNYIYIKTYFNRTYHSRLLFYDRLSWFIRAALSGTLSSYFKGLKLAKAASDKIIPYPINKRIQTFYIDNQRIFESPLKKIIRKYKHGILFKISKNV